MSSLNNDDLIDQSLKSALERLEANGVARKAISKLFDFVQWIGVLTVIQFAAVKLHVWPLRVLVISLIVVLGLWVSLLMSDFTTLLFGKFYGKKAKALFCLSVILWGCSSSASIIFIDKLVVILANSQMTACGPT